MNVYVVTNVESGWDCVCGVYASYESLLYFFIDYGRSYYFRCNENNEEYFPINENTTYEELEDYIQNGPYVIHEERLYE